MKTKKIKVRPVEWNTNAKNWVYKYIIPIKIKQFKK